MKPYDQYCPVAHALDLVGERWSLLLVRELQHGPLRYSDLHERLSRCSTNVLATRLKELEAGGVITRRRLPPPAASTVYELDGDGGVARSGDRGARALGPAHARPAAGGPREAAGWLEKALRTTVAAYAPDARIGFEIGGEQATVDAGHGDPGLIEDAEAVVTRDAGRPLRAPRRGRHRRGRDQRGCRGRRAACADARS